MNFKAAQRALGVGPGTLNRATRQPGFRKLARAGGTGHDINYSPKVLRMLKRYFKARQEWRRMRDYFKNGRLPR